MCVKKKNTAVFDNCLSSGKKTSSAMETFPFAEILFKVLFAVATLPFVTTSLRLQHLGDSMQSLFGLERHLIVQYYLSVLC